MMTALTEFQALLEDVCQGGFVSISEKVNHVTIIERTKPKTDSESITASAPVFGQAVQSSFTISVPTISVFPFSSFGSRSQGPRQRLQPRRRRSFYCTCIMFTPSLYTNTIVLFALSCLGDHLSFPSPLTHVHIMEKSKLRCKEREKELRDIVKYIKRSTQAVEDDSEKIFTRLQRSIDRKHLEVKELIRGEERIALGQTEKLLERLNQQIVEHRRGEADLEMLSNTEDHINFLQNYKTLCAPPDTGGRPSIDVHPYFSLLILRKALAELRDKVNEVCDRELTKIAELVGEEHDQSAENSLSCPLNTDTAHRHLHQTEPRTRGDFLQCEFRVHSW
ncbi:hypothetical protein G5714_002343 [Onychostoma macrolepis]|uniref:TRIM8/14/16/25/29/45/65 coiled-coil region domain-containing protein n=1 Tax=Onychostoma macrolepis TaxID=369639 RepID=A0A7J6DEW0_9TELE|nr:hypothetical protein G5714_002343 [Onychostoma macrolepis]